MSSNDEIVQQLSHRPQELLTGVISNPQSALPPLTPINRVPRSTLGKLDKLPLEVVQRCLVHVDIQTLQSISKTGLRGRDVVNSMPELNQLKTTIEGVMKVLAKTQTLHLHSVHDLRAALLSEECASCGSYGPLLHLLHGERCCFPCLRQNHSLWLISVAVAKNVFVLTNKQMKGLPIMRNIPGHYHVQRPHETKRSIRFTSVGTVKKLALKVHGSLRNLEEICPWYALPKSRSKIRNCGRPTRKRR